MRLYTLKNGLVVLAEVIGQCPYFGVTLYQPIVTGTYAYVMAWIVRHNVTFTEA